MLSTFAAELESPTQARKFCWHLGKKIQRIISYEESSKEIEQIARELASTPDSRPVTYALTYLGILELPEEYKQVVSDFNMEPYSPVEGFFLYVSAYDDNRLLHVCCCQRFNSDHVAKAIAAELERLNVKPSFKDAGTLDGDKVFIDKLKHV